MRAKYWKSHGEIQSDSGGCLEGNWALEALGLPQTNFDR